MGGLGLGAENAAAGHPARSARVRADGARPEVGLQLRRLRPLHAGRARYAESRALRHRRKLFRRGGRDRDDARCAGSGLAARSRRQRRLSHEFDERADRFPDRSDPRRALGDRQGAAAPRDREEPRKRLWRSVESDARARRPLLRHHAAGGQSRRAAGA